MGHNTTRLAIAAQPVEVARQRAVASGIFAIVLGLILVFSAGLAQPDMLHNAAHDARHAFAFPCH